MFFNWFVKVVLTNVIYIVCTAFILTSSQTSLYSQNSQIDSLKHLLVEKKLYRDSVKILNSIAKEFYMVSSDSIFKYTDLAYSLSHKNNYEEGKAHALNVRGLGYITLSDFDTATTYFKKSLVMFEEIKDVKGIATSSNNLGGVYYFEKDLYNSYKYFNKSLEVYQSAERIMETGPALSNIGLIYLEFKNFDKALEYYKKSLEVYQLANNKRGVGSILMAIGQIYQKKGDSDLAFYYFHKSLNTSIELKDILEQAYNYNCLGEVYYNMGQYEKSNFHMKRALNLVENLQVDELYATILLNIAKNEFALTNIDSAAVYGVQTYNFAKDKNNIETTLDASELLYKVALEKQENEKIMFYAAEIIALNDSIKSLYNDFGLIEKKINFETKELEQMRIQEKELLAQQRMWLITMGLCFTLIMAFILYRNHLKLKKAHAKMEVSNNAKSLFLSKMTHEIRTPLNAIMGYTEILKDTKLTSNQSNFANTIYTAAESLLHMANDILDLSNQKKGKTTLKEEPHLLREVIEPLLKMIDINAMEKGLDLCLHYDERIQGKLLIDKVKLQQVVLNLLNNSIKFTEDGSITLSVKLVQETSETVKILLSVLDTGNGIKEENQAKIFEEFYQEVISEKVIKNGVGLGLTISNHLLGLMGTKLQLQSTIGKGSDFYFEIVLEKCAESNDKLAESTVSKCKKVSRESIILVVDDNNVNLLLVRKMLMSLHPHFKVVEASDGGEGISAYKEFHPDLVIMDLHMPGIDGYEATSYIRSLEYRPIPIIACSADYVEKDPTFFKSHGFTDFLAKPIRKKELEKVLYTHLGKEVAKFQKHLIT